MAMIVSYCVCEVELTGDDSDEMTTSSFGLDQAWDTYQVCLSCVHLCTPVYT